jgi:hypothetical protein
MKIVWARDAVADLLELSQLAAMRIDTSVQLWEAEGVGIVHAAAEGAFHLYVDDYVVVFYLDLLESVMHVGAVRPAANVPPPDDDPSAPNAA